VLVLRRDKGLRRDRPEEGHGPEEGQTGRLPQTVDRLITKGCFRVARIGPKMVRIPYIEVQKSARKINPT